MQPTNKWRVCVCVCAALYLHPDCWHTACCRMTTNRAASANWRGGGGHPVLETSGIRRAGLLGPEGWKNTHTETKKELCLSDIMVAITAKLVGDRSLFLEKPEGHNNTSEPGLNCLGFRSAVKPEFLKESLFIGHYKLMPSSVLMCCNSYLQWGLSVFSLVV
jgi:hypothetical protein